MRPERIVPLTDDVETCVAQVHSVFFEKSETFIYHYAVHFRQFHPVFIARQFINQDQFPIPSADCRPFSAPRSTWNWFWQAIGRRFLGRELLAEQFLKQRHARLLHAHFGPSGVEALGLKRSLKIPLVTTFYGYDMSHASTLAARKESYQALFREGDLFLAEGPHMRSRLIELGSPPEKTAVQRIALPLERISFRRRKPKKKEETVIVLFSGRFVEKKGILQALAAVKEARVRQPGIEFRIAGDGPLKARVVETIVRDEMSGYTKLLGFLSYNDLVREMTLADIFISPSQTAGDGDSEGGAPTSILEAQALGIPVVSTLHADIPYVVDAGRSALLSPEGDASGLAENLQRLLENRDTWEAMGEAGRERVEARHDIRKEIVALEEKYGRLIAQGGRTSQR